jgi:hypothetical protein
MSQQPSDQATLYNSIFDTADAYSSSHKELEGRALCLDLLNKPDLTTVQEARAHYILAGCGENRAWHARQSILLYGSTRIIGNGQEDEGREMSIGLAKDVLFQILMAQGKRGEADAVKKSAGGLGAPAQTSQEFPIDMPKFFRNRYLEAKGLFESGCASGDQENFRDAFEICDELLLYPNLPTFEKASAHLLLASSSDANPTWHAKQAVELFERLVADATEAGDLEVQGSMQRFLKNSKSAVEETEKRANGAHS